MEILNGGKVPVNTWAPIAEIEYSALDQLNNVAELPWAYDHIAVMPDVHAGKGATIGTVIATTDSLMPSCVGVDIACGMTASKTGIKFDQFPSDWKMVREAIEAKVPVGFNSHQNAVVKDLPWFELLYADVQDRKDKAIYQIGTLGGGNHFIEISFDEDDFMWIMCHSGSRNIGKTVADWHIARAKNMPDNKQYGDLARFTKGTKEFAEYLCDLQWMQNYADLNRKNINILVLDVLNEVFNGLISMSDYVSCHHNYVEHTQYFKQELYITRKGAINAGKNIKGIIPGSMGTASFIVNGHSTYDAWWSASHGAGRKMSRGEAKRTFTQEDIDSQLEFVESKKDKTVLDELPGAYKDVRRVMEQQADLVTPIHTLHQIISIKG